ncbi:MAG TPA: hypothetical protein PLM75_12705, partial [bacterium]|nr:hypothetical protein [bacterium]
EGIKDIPIEAQVAALCDIFDALTSQRCYKNALGSFPAFKIMFNEMGDALNRDLLAEFIKLFKDYGN